MTKLIEKIATGLDGEKLVTQGYGTYLLATKAWEKNGKSRVYLTGRFVGSDGKVSAAPQQLGYIELISGGEVICATKSYHEQAVRDLIAPALAI